MPSLLRHYLTHHHHRHYSYLIFVTTVINVIIFSIILTLWTSILYMYHEDLLTSQDPHNTADIYIYIYTYVCAP